MKANNTLTVTDIQHFCMHDGPGIRTTVFLKGCPLHCTWCHNPETVNPKPEIMFAKSKCLMCGACAQVCPLQLHAVGETRTFYREKCTACGRCAKVCAVKALTLSGKEMSADEILSDVMRDAAFYGKSGGITLSGGEPSLQENIIELLEKAKEKGITTCVETCGVFTEEMCGRLIPVTDTFLYDIKDTDAERLHENTGATFSQILENLRKIDAAGKKTVLRCILIPGVNMNDEHIKKLAGIFRELKNCECAEILPYHPYGISKAEQIGKDDVPVFDKPEREEVLKFANKLKDSGVTVKCFGSII